MGDDTPADAIESLTSGQLARLLKLESADALPGWSEADGADALRHQWRSLLLPDLAEVPGAEAGRLSEACAGRTFLEALTGDDEAAEVLEGVKQFARHVREQPPNPLRGGPATVIYYAAIAAGVRRGVRITRLGDEALREGFTWSMRQAGTEAVAGVFGEALRMLEGGRGKAL